MGFILSKTWRAALILLAVLTLVFFLSRATGDPIMLMIVPETPKEEIARIRSELGLDQPYHIQYLQYLSHAARGDFGRSLRSGRPAMQLVAQRIPNSLSLAGVAIVIALLLGLPLGIVSAVKRGTLIDQCARVIASTGVTLPSFVMGILLMELFSVRLGMLPAAGMGDVRHFILPGVTLGVFTMAALVRLLRSSMLDALGAEFILLARMKGVAESRVILKHALRNSLLSTFTYASTTLVQIVTAGVVTETVFAWPGLGRLTYEAVMARDFPVTQAAILTAAALVVVTNLSVDIAYSYLDPRIRQH